MILNSLCLTSIPLFENSSSCQADRNESINWKVIMLRCLTSLRRYEGPFKVISCILTSKRNASQPLVAGSVPNIEVMVCHLTCVYFRSITNYMSISQAAIRGV